MTEEAYLQAISARPDDDAPRLKFARWLDQHGQCDRAEFLVLQCVHARLDPWDPRRSVLWRRQAELLTEHREEWLGPERLRVARAHLWHFVRGFPEALDARQTLTVPPGWDTAEDWSDLESEDSVGSEGEELDLEVFKRSLGTAPPAKFNAEGGLRERWQPVNPCEHRRQPVEKEINCRAGTYVDVNFWEAANKRRRRAEALWAALVFLAFGAAAFWAYRHPAERAKLLEFIKSLVSDHPWQQLRQDRVQNTIMSRAPVSMSNHFRANCASCGNELLPSGRPTMFGLPPLGPGLTMCPLCGQLVPRR
jgi:uncharacterized protein (TIGR02996 family)